MSRVEYAVTTIHRSDVKLKSQEKSSSEEKKVNADLVLKSIRPPRSVSQEEKKREANRPLYLIRYE